ncbi:hypothetical protein JZ751_029081 [Albula glossodonta]|uniref:Uncharacterized protein n=1 Tax=Albula glossodonta TaxID=121402 RepID=A0A8T2P841_9TELE|nr:hypothetical protein JZ751_029081 [Albula glossodonta]
MKMNKQCQKGSYSESQKTLCKWNYCSVQCCCHDSEEASWCIVEHQWALAFIAAAFYPSLCLEQHRHRKLCIQVNISPLCPRKCTENPQPVSRQQVVNKWPHQSGKGSGPKSDTVLTVIKDSSDFPKDMHRETKQSLPLLQDMKNKPVNLPSTAKH